MGLRTAGEYQAGLPDGRRVFYRGEKVIDVAGHPELALAVNHSAGCFSIAAERPDLVVRKDSERGDYSAFYHLPRSAEDLRAQASRPAGAAGAGSWFQQEGGDFLPLRHVGVLAMVSPRVCV